MATTSNTFTGNGSTTNYSFTFEYLEQDEVKVELDGVASTAFTFANATTLSFTTAPGNGVVIRIFRNTDSDTLKATFFPGSAIKAEDLNDNFTQNLFVTQEADNNVTTSIATANTAKTTADSAVTTANAAQTSANSAVTTANSAVTTANTASTNATTAVNTANTANTTANTALTTANAASAAVSNVVAYAVTANVAAIPGSPSNNDYIEISDSTGIESFTPLSGLPSGFVGAAGLTVRLRYDSSTTSWVWVSYFANDSESRYLTKNIPVVTGDSTNGSGQITLNCETNTHGVKIKGPPHSAAANYTLTLPNNDGNANDVLQSDGSGNLSWVAQSGGVSYSDTTANFTGTLQNGGSNVVVDSDIGSTVQAYDATILKNANIGVSVQAYDADTAKTDAAQTFTAAQRGEITTLTSGATVTPDFADSNNYTLTLGANLTIANPTNLTVGQSGSIFLVQDGTGSRTAAWGSYWDFAGGTAPTLTTTAAAVDRVDYVVRTTGSIHAVATLNYS